MLFLLATLLFLIPTNLFLKFGEDQAYINGLFSDYVLLKLYGSDLVVLGLVGWGLWLLRNKIQFKQLSILPLLLFTVLFFRQLVTPLPLVGLSFLIRALLFTTTGWILFQYRTRIQPKHILISICVTILFQSLVALYQFHWQESLAGYLFFGEPTLSHVSGIARTIHNGQELILPYGTTAHPNVLAGFLVVYLLVGWSIWWQDYRQKNGLSTIWALTSCLGLYVLLLTESVSAWLSMALGSVYLLLLTKNKLSLLAEPRVQFGLSFLLAIVFIVTPLLLPFVEHVYPQTQSLERRVYLNQAATKIIETHPVFGVGVQQFVTEVEKATINREVVRFIQPAHHTGLLFLAETGLLGLIVVLSFLIKQPPANRNMYLVTFLILSPILVLDHYLYTLQTGQLLVVILLTLNSFGQKKAPL